MRLWPVAVSILAIGPAPAQTTTSTPDFEAVAIRQANAGVPSAIRGGPGTNDPGRITWIAPLRFVIQRAFDIEPDQLTGPDWLGSINWEISAALPPGATQEQFQQMLQSMLAERFHFQFHRDMRNFPAYNLTVGKNGPRWKTSEYVPPPRRELQPGQRDFSRVPVYLARQGGVWTLTGRGATIADFIRGIRSGVRARIIDQTGLTGKYDFTLSYDADPTGAPGGLLLDAVRDLGLNLAETKVSLPVIVVGSVARTPEAN